MGRSGNNELVNISGTPLPTPAVSAHRATLPGVFWPGRPARSAEVEAERGLATLFLLLRLGFAGVIVLGSITGTETSQHPLMYAALAAVVIIHIAVMVGVTWRSETVLPQGWGWVDLIVSLAAIVGCGVLLPAHVVVGTWESWASGYATGTAAAAGVWCRRPRIALALSVGIGVVYTVTAEACSDADLTTVVGNAVTYPIFGITAILFAVYWRRLAAGADTATEFAIKAAEQAQADRYRLTVHDPASILRLLGDENTPAVQLAALRRQATEESHRLRAYLNDSPDITATMTAHPKGSAATLGAVITDTTAGFTDLPIDLLIDLGANVPIPAPSAAPLSAALTTLLHNVRMHADATDVTLHADATDTTWEIVLTDNGRGFEPAPMRYGFGLRHQVIQSLAEHHITTVVHSAPGHGTTITLTGPAQPTTPLSTKEPQR